MPQLGQHPNLPNVTIPRNTRPEFSRAPSTLAVNMAVEPESRLVKKLSEDEQWFIYNVGPWHYNQAMGSMGTFVIPALEKEFVLGDKGSEHEFSAAVLQVPIPGMPNETYPGERKATRDYFAPNADEPGRKFAEAICDAGRGEKDLMKRGIFISQIAERYTVTDDEGNKTQRWRAPSRPDKNAPEEQRENYKKFCGQVKAAQQRLKERCEYLCTEGNAFAAQKQDFNLTSYHYDAARFLKKTTAQCPWLDGSREGTQKEPCPACGEPIKPPARLEMVKGELTFIPGIRICPSCKEQVVSDEVKEASLKHMREKKVA